MKNSLPSRWILTSLEEITGFVIGGDWGIDGFENGFEKSHVIRGTDYKHWNAIRASKSAIRYVKSSSLDKRALREGDMVLEVSGGGPDQPVGRVIVMDKRALESVQGKLTFSNFFRLIRIAEPLNSFYVKYYLDYAYSNGDFNEMQTHTTNLRNLRVSDFLTKTSVLIPPLPEQQRIVAKLDELMGKIDRSRARLERIPQILKRFRQSILSAAVTGKLTEEWRERNGIIEEWEEKQLKALVERFTYGSSQKSEDAGKVPVLRMGNIQDGKIVWDDLKYSSDKKEIEKYKLQNGDLLFNRTNSPELVGKTAIYRSERDAIYAGYLIKIKVGDQLSAEFLNICLNTPQAREWCNLVKTDGVSQSNINAQKLGEFIVHAPSISEQEQIVKVVQMLFSFADKIEARYNKAKAQLDKLPQALMAKAFSGELVPQDESDEPASVLLERIKKATAAPASTKKSKRYKLEEERLSQAAEAADRIRN